jgi:hypothetical protein
MDDTYIEKDSSILVCFGKKPTYKNVYIAVFVGIFEVMKHT